MITVREAIDLIHHYRNDKAIKPNAPVMIYLCREGTEEMIAVPASAIGCDPKTGRLFFTVFTDGTTPNTPPAPSMN